MTDWVPGAAWEAALVKHYLNSDGPGGSARIRYIDARPEELAKALESYNGIRLCPDEARSLFARCFDPDELRRLFGSGCKPAASDVSVPGYFRHLVLTCMIQAVDGGTDTKEFRSNLGREIIGPGETFGSLEHLPELWADLVDWIEMRKARGQSLRSLVLPHPRPWRIIGHSVKLAFPSWRDRGAMRHLVAGSAFPTPRSLIDQLSRRISSHGGAGSLKSAYDDFRSRYRAGERMLRRHPFWLLAHETLVDLAESAGDTLVEPLIVELREGLDHDLEFLLRAPGSDAPIDTGDFAKIDELLNGDIAGVLRSSAQRLRHILGQGWITLERIGHGVWATDPFSVPRSYVRVVASAPGKRRWFGVRTNWKEIGDGWFLSDEIDPTEHGVGSIVGSVSSDADDLVREVELFGGTRLGNGSYLGRPGTLPFVRAPENAQVELTALDPGAPEARVEHCEAATEFEIAADGPLIGRWELSVRERTAAVGDTFEDPRIITFDPFARIHEVTHPDVENIPDSDPEIVGLRSVDADSGFVPWPPVEPARSGGMDDLAFDIGEMVYAKGRSGISEFDLVPAIRRIVPRHGPAIWDVLRAFQEAGWLDVRRTPGWGARRWFLRPPRLVQVAGSGWVVDGAMPYRRVDELRLACQRAGIPLEERPSTSPWAPPLFRVVDDDGGAAVAADLVWRTIEPTWPKSDPPPQCWPATTYTTGGRRAETAWSWRRGGFVWADAAVREADDVRLVRWTRERRDAPDIFVVSAADREPMVTESRTAAILEAHRRARRPLFEFDGIGLRRLANDGFLPLSIVRALRWHVLADCGPEHVADGIFGYRYRIPVGAAMRLAGIFGTALRVRSRRENDIGHSRALGLRRTPAGRYVRGNPNFL